MPTGQRAAGPFFKQLEGHSRDAGPLPVRQLLTSKARIARRVSKTLSMPSREQGQVSAVDERKGSILGRRKYTHALADVPAWQAPWGRWLQSPSGFTSASLRQHPECSSIWVQLWTTAAGTHVGAFPG